MRITVFPHLQPLPGTRPNPYIHDMVEALAAQPGVSIANAPHRNPLLSLLRPSRVGDVVILNWFESIPDFRHGLIQTAIAVLWLGWLKLTRRKIVYIFHNKRPHNPSRPRLKKLLTRLALGSDLIVTHATEGKELIESTYPLRSRKVYFLHHPTKDRLDGREEVTPQFDLLVWGHISAHKGVTDLLDFLTAHPRPWRVCIAGACTDAGLRRRIENYRLPGVEVHLRALSFDELRGYIDRSRFVLVPYHTESVLSSGILMDSLSFGARVIGPDTGSFRDYARESRLRVYTFHTLDDLPHLLREHADKPISPTDYRDFLTENDWPHFAARLLALIGNIGK